MQIVYHLSDRTNSLVSWHPHFSLDIFGSFSSKFIFDFIHHIGYKIAQIYTDTLNGSTNSANSGSFGFEVADL